MEANNMAAMREALVAILDEKCKQCYINDQICTQGLECHWNGKRGEICQDKAMDKAIAALAAPPRNCDIGSPEEQTQRMEKFCKSHGHGFDEQKCYSCENCKLISVDRCELAWAQMPYEEGGTV